jgi:hypothetical protein
VRLRAVTLSAGTIPVVLTACAQTLYTNTAVRRNATYSAGASAFTTAGSATDLATLAGSATKTIKVFNVGYSATQTTQDFQNVTLVKRSTANSGGTSAAMTAVSYDSQDGAATATALRYTANPTTGTLVGSFRPSKVLIPLDVPDRSATAQMEKLWTFGTANDQKALYLRGTGEVLAINQAGVTFAGNSTSCFFEWTEE